MKRKLSITLSPQYSNEGYRRGDFTITELVSGGARIEYTGDEQDFKFHVEELDRYVKVEFLDPHPLTKRLTRELWTYRDATKDGLKVGEIVNAPTRYAYSNRAIVRELGAHVAFNVADARTITHRLAAYRD